MAARSSYTRCIRVSDRIVLVSSSTQDTLQVVTSEIGSHGQASQTLYIGYLQSLLESSLGLVFSVSFCLVSTIWLMLFCHCKFNHNSVFLPSLQAQEDHAPFCSCSWLPVVLSPDVREPWSAMGWHTSRLLGCRHDTNPYDLQVVRCEIART